MSTPRLLAYLGAGLLVTVIMLEAVVGVGFGAVPIALITGAAAALLAIAIWQDRPSESRRCYVSLGAVFCLYYGVSYGFAVLGAPPPFAERILFFGLDRVDLLPLPVGILAWYLGYRFLHTKTGSRAARRLVLPTRTLRPVSAGTLSAFYAVTALIRVGLIATGIGYGYLRDASEVTTSVSSFNQYLVLVGEFGIVILGLTIVASGRAPVNQAAYQRAFLLMLPVELTLRVLAGSKQSLLLFAVMLVFSLLAAGKLSFSPRRIAAIAIVTVLVVFPLIGTYRDLVRPAPGQQLAAVDAPTAAVLAIRQTAENFADGPGTYAGFAFDQTAGRLREIDRAAVSIQAHDGGKAYSPPSEMLERTATGFIPRVLWPDKPLNLYALDVSREYYGLSVISASSLSPVGDAYRYGGLLMVAIGLALVGGFVRFLDEMLDPRHSIWLVPLLVAAIPLIRGGDLVGLLVGAIRYFVILGILYRFLFIRATRGQVRTSRTPRADRAYTKPGESP